jgi:hypothetical protein
MEDIKRIARPTDVPDYGLLNDLLWSDPSETAVDWEDNERGVSYCFGKSVINEFLAKVLVTIEFWSHRLLCFSGIWTSYVVRTWWWKTGMNFGTIGRWSRSSALRTIAGVSVMYGFNGFVLSKRMQSLITMELV